MNKDPLKNKLHEITDEFNKKNYTCKGLFVLLD